MACTRYWTWAIAVVWSGDIAPEVLGGMTAATCGACRASASADVIAACSAGSVSLCPAGAVKTIWALVPAAAGKSCCIRFRACCDWEPGMVKVSSSFPAPPTVTAQATTAAIAASQAARTSRRWRKERCPRRYKTVAMAVPRGGREAEMRQYCHISKVAVLP